MHVRYLILSRHKGQKFSSPTTVWPTKSQSFQMKLPLHGWARPIEAFARAIRESQDILGKKYLSRRMAATLVSKMLLLCSQRPERGALGLLQLRRAVSFWSRRFALPRVDLLFAAASIGGAHLLKIQVQSIQVQSAILQWSIRIPQAPTDRNYGHH